MSDARLASACGQHRAVCVRVVRIGSTPAKYSKLVRSPASFVKEISSKNKQKNHHRADNREERNVEDISSRTVFAIEEI